MTDPIRILVVDDEAPQMKALCDTLRDHDYATTGFTNGQAALDALKPGQFDLLLTDLMMPGMNGIDLLTAALGRDPDLIGILMTGAGTIASAVEAMKCGAFDYLLKPFKLNELLPVLSRALMMRQLRQDNNALQKGMRQRTEELEAVNKDLESFSYSVSHDLRAPLRSIDGFSHALLDDMSSAISPEGNDFLRRIIAATKRMGSLIDDLLSLSQVGRGALRRTQVDLSRMANEICTRLQESQPERRVECLIQEQITSDCDAGLISAVLENLLGNAWKFTRNQPQPRISFTAAGGIHHVRDNGAGFNMAYANRLFGTFQRLHAQSDFEGTGIGLATVQRIVRRHGGRIWAIGEVGLGATFSFTLDGDAQADQDSPRSA